MKSSEINMSVDSVEGWLREIAYQFAVFNETILPVIQEKQERTRKQREEWLENEARLRKTSGGK